MRFRNEKIRQHNFKTLDHFHTGRILLPQKGNQLKNCRRRRFIVFKISRHLSVRPFYIEPLCFNPLASPSFYSSYPVIRDL